MRRTLRWVGIGLLWVGVSALVYMLLTYGRFSMIDFHFYYAAAETLGAGLSPYVGEFGMFYWYPPLLAQGLMPLAAAFPYDQAAFVWCLFNLALILGTALLLSRYTPSGERWAVWLLPPLFWGFLEAMVVGQVTILLLALFAAAWAARKTDHPWITGLMLALATWIKLYPALLILYFVWKRDWRVVWSAAFSGVALLLVQVLISGVDVMAAMLPVLFALSSSGQAHLLVQNTSVLGFTSQLFAPGDVVQPLIVSPMLSFLSRAILSVGLVLGVAWSSPAGAFYKDERFDLEFALALLTSLLLSPTLWVSGMPPLALVFFLLWRRRPTGLVGRRIAWWCLIAPVILTLYYIFVLGYTPAPPLPGVLVAFGFYVLIITWALIFLSLVPRAQAFRSAAI